MQQAETFQAMEDYYNKVFGFDLPLWRQYVNYWIELFHGDFGISVFAFPKPVSELISGALPYSIGLLLPAILLSWLVGNKLGAAAARRRWLDNTLLPDVVPADRHAVRVDGDPAVVVLRRRVGDLPHRLRLRPDAGAGVLVDASSAACSATGSCRSCRCSSCSSADGRSACATS